MPKMTIVSDHGQITMTTCVLRSQSIERTIPASRFKAQCLALLDEVAESGEAIVDHEARQAGGARGAARATAVARGQRHVPRLGRGADRTALGRTGIPSFRDRARYAHVALVAGRGPQRLSPRATRRDSSGPRAIGVSTMSCLGARHARPARADHARPVAAPRWIRQASPTTGSRCCQSPSRSRSTQVALSRRVSRRPGRRIVYATSLSNSDVAARDARSDGSQDHDPERVVW